MLFARWADPELLGVAALGDQVDDGAVCRYFGTGCNKSLLYVLSHDLGERFLPHVDVHALTFTVMIHGGRLLRRPRLYTDRQTVGQTD